MSNSEVIFELQDKKSTSLDIKDLLFEISLCLKNFKKNDLTTLDTDFQTSNQLNPITNQDKNPHLIIIQNTLFKIAFSKVTEFYWEVLFCLIAIFNGKK
jgi:hypothetical protein